MALVRITHSNMQARFMKVAAPGVAPQNHGYIYSIQKFMSHSYNAKNLHFILIVNSILLGNYSKIFYCTANISGNAKITIKKISISFLSHIFENTDILQNFTLLTMQPLFSYISYHPSCCL